MGAPGTTPGKWAIGKDMIGQRDERGFQRLIVEMLWDDAQGVADAHQIAASGALYDAGKMALKALIGVDALLHKHGMMAGITNPAIEPLSAALALARGEA